MTTLDPAAPVNNPNYQQQQQQQAIPLDESDFLNWNENQVSNWINNLSFLSKESKFHESFLENNIDGSVLPYLTTSHLKEIGIENLSVRLLIKKSINELIIHSINQNASNLTKIDSKLTVNNNYINLEVFNFSIKILSNLINKYNNTSSSTQARSPSSQQNTLTASSSTSNTEIRKINDNIAKLKNDLVPVIKYVKDLKPLPTPDQANFNASLKSPSIHSPTNNYTTSPTQSIHSSMSNNTMSLSNPPLLTPNTLKSMNRISSGSLVSMGTGKVIQQSIMKPELNKVKSETSLARTTNHNSNQLPNSGKKDYFNNSSVPSPTYSTKSNSTLQQSQQQQQPQLQHHQSTSALPRSSAAINAPPQPSHTEPLKQLRASSDDSCHKVLQQAMKRHHIPRNDWGKYVLVICYGDKERILKLSEKPVMIFRELQEMGKHPAIMLRQLAEDIGGDHEESRIGDEIPGGRL